MALTSGTRHGPYEIQSPPAQVAWEACRPRDTRLEHTVAIKVLNAQLVSSTEPRPFRTWS